MSPRCGCKCSRESVQPDWQWHCQNPQASHGRCLQQLLQRPVRLGWQPHDHHGIAVSQAISLSACGFTGKLIKFPSPARCHHRGGPGGPDPGSARSPHRDRDRAQARHGTEHQIRYPSESAAGPYLARNAGGQGGGEAATEAACVGGAACEVVVDGVDGTGAGGLAITAMVYQVRM